MKSFFFLNNFVFDMSNIFDLAFMWFVIVLCCLFVCLEMISWGITIVVYSLLLIFCPITVRHIISLRALQSLHFRVQTFFIFFDVFRPVNRDMFGEIIACLVCMFKNWKLLFKNICENTYGWKSALKCVKCCLKTKNCCLKI